MSYVHALDMDALKLAFKQIIDVDTDLFAKQKTVDSELEKLKQTHNALIKENNKKIFIFCLDSFYFQYRILHQEMEELSRFIIILNNRMYGEYYKLYNIIVTQLTERNILLQTISQHKKYPVYRDLEQMKEYSIADISEIHDTILNIINELYIFYSLKQQTVKDYSHTNNINRSITNFIHTLEYENTLIREQLYLYVSYIDFFHSTQKRYLDKLAKRMANFQKDVSENIINDTNTSFIENICNIKDVIKTSPSSPASSVQSDLCSIESINCAEPIDTLVDEIIIGDCVEHKSFSSSIHSLEVVLQNPTKENIAIVPYDVASIAYNLGLNDIITVDDK
jgi:hypothetical protein